jgi:predicted  nucleic acid-binding Zn-ribbon protein
MTYEQLLVDAIVKRDQRIAELEHEVKRWKRSSRMAEKSLAKALKEQGCCDE